MAKSTAELLESIGAPALPVREQQQEQPAATDATYDRQEVIVAAKADVNFLAGLAMPTVFTYFLPPVMLTVWALLTQAAHKTRDFTQLALGIPRGHGKTTLIKLYILYCILFTEKHFILVISATATLAENVIADVVDMLNESNIKTIFGDWKLGCEKDTEAIKKFGFRGRNIILAGIGAGGSLRVLNMKNERPDVMVFEDVQTRECADSEVQSKALLQWMLGTAMKAKSPKGCTFAFLGNMYPTKHSILKKLKANPRWIKFISGAILADGTALWEDLQPLTQLLDEFENDLSMGHPEIFMAEVMNDDEASANNRIDLSAIKECPYTLADEPQGKAIIIDPADDKSTSDDTTIGLVHVYDETPVFMDSEEAIMSPGDTIRRALRMAVTNNCHVIAVESNAYQRSLLYWFNFICTQVGFSGIHFVELYSGSASKNTRIAEALRAVNKGDSMIASAIRNKVVKQIIDWNPLKRDNTDGLLDILAYMPKCLELYGDLMETSSELINSDWNETKVLSVEKTCNY